MGGKVRLWKLDFDEKWSFVFVTLLRTYTGIKTVAPISISELDYPQRPDKALHIVGKITVHPYSTPTVGP